MEKNVSNASLPSWNFLLYLRNGFFFGVVERNKKDVFVGWIRINEFNCTLVRVFYLKWKWVHEFYEREFYRFEFFLLLFLCFWSDICKKSIFVFVLSVWSFTFNNNADRRKRGRDQLKLSCSTSRQRSACAVDLSCFGPPNTIATIQ